MRQWIKTKVLDYSLDEESLKAEVRHEYRRRKIELTTEAQIEEIVKSAIYSFEQEFYNHTYQKLSPTSISRMDAQMESWIDMENEETGEESEDKNKITYLSQDYTRTRSSKQRYVTSGDQQVENATYARTSR